MKSDSQLQKNCLNCFDQSPFQMMKNAFFWWKVLFVSNKVKYLSWLDSSWWSRSNGLIRKMRPISKFMTSQYGTQTMAIHMLLNISQNKRNQTIKFGQLVEYNKRDIFLKIHTENKSGRLVPDLFFCFLRRRCMR